ncbi:MAG: methyltransferase regulatory domain-containing protein [Verrucomicrobia bacterium]|nr:methyltransferase regulatory domain-containing protein [Verrucomicrobiota bacterium]
MEAAKQIGNVYDKVLYPSSTLPQTHPSRLATIAYLRGVEPAPVDHCRVLELGCGTAANLIPMAFHLPESEFIGLDLAKRPIAAGQSFIKGLGLSNIILQSMDLLEARMEQLGRFDFIIAHGLYSWVPLPVRERILEICQEMLNPQGVAYVSYNAYPGNHFRDLVRGMMRFHSSVYESPAEKIGQAKGILKLVAHSRAKPDYYTEAIQAELNRILKYTDAGFFHDDLGEINQPFYFHEFMADAKRYGLQFLGESGANELNHKELTQEALRTMRELEAADEVVREQFKDFLIARGFRQTILCRGELELAPNWLVDRVTGLYASCDAVRVDNAKSADPSPIVFQRPGGDEIEMADPFIAAAFDFLRAQYPCYIGFQEIVEAARTGAGTRSEKADEAVDATKLAQVLRTTHSGGFLGLNIWQPKVVNRVTDRPATTKLARFQLTHGESATNQLHISRRFPDPFARQLVLLLDGTRDRAMLTRDMIEFAKSTGGPIFEKGVQVTDQDQIPAAIERQLPAGLQSLARDGMLIS